MPTPPYRKSISIVRWLTLGVVGALCLASCQRSTPEPRLRPEDSLLRENVHKTLSQRSFHVEVLRGAAGTPVDSLSIDYEAPDRLRIRRSTSGGMQESIVLGRERFMSTDNPGKYTAFLGGASPLDEYLIALRVIADAQAVTKSGSTFSVTLVSDPFEDDTNRAEVVASPEGIATLKLFMEKNRNAHTTYEFRNYGKAFAIQRPDQSLLEPMKTIPACPGDSSSAPLVCSVG